MIEFMRFVIVACFIVFFAYLTEVLIARTFEKLIAAKSQLETLTGLFNRRHFDRVLSVQMSRVKRSEDLLALVIIDIDHFKRYNDTFGHPAGDLALISLANLLSVKMRRASDAVFRIGGEEFALLYQTENQQAALQVIEDIRKSVESLNEYCELAEPITVSAGVLYIHAKQNLSGEQAYKLADSLLYKAKHSGRNNVVTSA